MKKNGLGGHGDRAGSGGSVKGDGDCQPVYRFIKTDQPTAYRRNSSNEWWYLQLQVNKYLRSRDKAEIIRQNGVHYPSEKDALNAAVSFRIDEEINRREKLR